jgi:hypothetical protein
MSDIEAYNYHKTRYENGDIYVYQENGIVLGYYERYFKEDVCYLYNVYVNDSFRKGKVFIELYRNFFSTMPKHIKYIIGEKQKLGGKMQKVLITRRDYGKH